MSKETTFGEGHAVPKHVPEVMVGSVLEIIETLGLQDKQEKAVKSLIKGKIYDLFYDGNEYLSDSLFTYLREIGIEKRRKARKENKPMRGLTIEDIR